MDGKCHVSPVVWTWPGVSKFFTFCKSNKGSKLIVFSTVERLKLFKSQKKEKKIHRNIVPVSLLSNKEMNCQKERFSSAKCLEVQNKDGNNAVHKIWLELDSHKSLKLWALKRWSKLL